MNKAIISGRMTKDPELRFLPDGKAVSTFTLAVNRMKKGEADFIKVTVWGNSAESVAKYCFKGSLAEVDGSIRTGSYEKDGKKVYTTDIMANQVNFLDTKKKDGENSESADPFDEIISDAEIPF